MTVMELRRPAGIAIALVATVVLSCGWRTDSYETFDTYSKDLAAREGWPLPFMPADASDIKVTSMIDDDRAWWMFRTQSREWLRDLRPAIAESVVVEKPPGSPWWPEQLSRAVKKPNAETTNYDIFMKKESTYFGPEWLYVFVERGSTAVYVHRPR